MPTENKNTNASDKIERQTWNPLRLAVLKLGLTEPAYTSPLNYQKKQGTFKCAYCGQQLFDSNAKYNSGSGWPSFWRTLADERVALKREFDGRVECSCQRCGSHLGHVFMDGPTPGEVSQEVLESAPSTDPRTTSGSRLPRYCINGAALMFDKETE
jgi:peptide-methionine (R)-S-oxide reductase